MNAGFRGVGVLALQGGFSNHVERLRSLGALVREVRTPADLIGLDALVLPGGESTTMTLGIEREDLAEPIAEFIRTGNPVLATCAGTILLDDLHLNLLDITCERNAYGGQTHSFEARFPVSGLGDQPFNGMFIRAPQIVRLGASVEVMAEHAGLPVAVRSGNITALTFHPELTDDDRFHRAFFEAIPVSHLTDVNAGAAARSSGDDESEDTEGAALN